MSVVAILVAVLIASLTLASGSTEGSPGEELVFISDPADAQAVQAAGFDGVLHGGMVHRFALSGADQPYFDEPEDLTDTTAFLQWWAQYGATGLVLHWNPAKAERRGVWQNPSFVSWNWYPANRWTPPRLWGVHPMAVFPVPSIHHGASCLRHPASVQRLGRTSGAG